YLRIEISGRIDRSPAGSNQVSRMQHGGREFLQQVSLDRRLAAAIIAERRAGSILGCGYLHTVTVHPDCSAMEKMPDAPPQATNKLARAIDRVTGQVDHDVGVEPGDPLAEAPLRLLGRTVEAHVGDPLPCIVLPVVFAEA